MGIFLFSQKQVLKPFYLFKHFFLCTGVKAFKTIVYFIGKSGFKLTKSERAPEPNHTSRQLRKETHYSGTHCKILVVMLSLGRGDIYAFQDLQVQR